METIGKLFSTSSVNKDQVEVNRDGTFSLSGGSRSKQSKSISYKLNVMAESHNFIDGAEDDEGVVLRNKENTEASDLTLKKMLSI